MTFYGNRGILFLWRIWLFARDKKRMDRKELQDMSFIPKPHEIYRHFKGNLYQITAIAEHTETGEQLVIYQALYGDFKTYARPLSMFVERVDKRKYPEADQEFRFELQGQDAERQRNCTEEKENTLDEEQEIAKEDHVSQIPEVIPESRNSQGEEENEELSIDPLVLEFLDSDSYEQRLNILAGLHHRITDEMITTMAIACDIEINDGETEERYEALKACLLTLERYECNRLR